MVFSPKHWRQLLGSLNLIQYLLIWASGKKELEGKISKKKYPCKIKKSEKIENQPEAKWYLYLCVPFSENEFRQPIKWSEWKAQHSVENVKSITNIR